MLDLRCLKLLLPDDHEFTRHGTGVHGAVAKAERVLKTKFGPAPARFATFVLWWNDQPMKYRNRMLKVPAVTRIPTAMDDYRLWLHSYGSENIFDIVYMLLNIRGA